MPKAILEFSLPEDQDDFEIANNAGKYYSVIWNLDRYLRDNIKYAPENAQQSEIYTLQKVRDELWEYINQYNLDLNK